MAAKDEKVVSLLDYGAGNVRSVENAIVKCGYKVHKIEKPEEIMQAEILVFPGVGSFGSAIERMTEKKFMEPLKEYIAKDKRFFGVCLGMQTLFEGSEEEPGLKGLGVIPGIVKRFSNVEEFQTQAKEQALTVPHIGWNGLVYHKPSRLFSKVQGDMNKNRTYFVHSYCAVPTPENKDWVLTTTKYGNEFISSVQKGNVMATQFHPEKSGELGLSILKGFLDSTTDPESIPENITTTSDTCTGISKRVIACLDVRKNDAGDLVVTKGDGYDVREKKTESEQEQQEEQQKEAEPPKKKGKVRNFGKPAQLAQRYYEEGADEITFLNITQFREDTLEADTLHEMLRAVSELVFVPLTIGGGIRDYGEKSALEVAARYFRSGADKVSLGSYAVEAVMRLRDDLKNQPDGTTAIEKISKVYGSQAVVISVDPRRIYLDTPEEIKQAEDNGFKVFDVIDDRKLKDKIAYNSWLKTSIGEQAPEEKPEEKDLTEEQLNAVDPKPAKCWFQCTVSGGRKRRSLDAIQLVQGCEKLGAGEILLNSIDKDGKNNGFDLALVSAICDAVSIPVIASSGAGNPGHFVDVFNKTDASAGLGAGIFHRSEYKVSQVKEEISTAGLPVRLSK